MYKSLMPAIRKLPNNIRWVIKAIFYLFVYLFWIVFNRKSLPPHSYKVFYLIYIGKKYHAETFVETGTYLGDTIDFLKPFFNSLYSIELDKKLYNRAKKYFKGINKIKIFHGDSSTVLPELLPKLKKTTLFWLDAHYSGGFTTKGEKDTPIINELNSLKKYFKKDFVVLIDDARMFNGKSSYPKINSLREFVSKKWNNAEIRVVYDVIQIIFS